MDFFIVLVLVVGIYCIAELVFKHREKMALIAKGQATDDDDGNEGEE